MGDPYDDTLDEPYYEFLCDIHAWEGIVPCPACADDEADRQYDERKVKREDR